MIINTLTFLSQSFQTIGKTALMTLSKPGAKIPEQNQKNKFFSASEYIVGHFFF